MNMMDLVGRTLGNYRIESPLDAGGMGQVFRGVHIYLNRPAAIKVMRGSFAANPKFRARFLQEARAAAALKHPNIVDIYEFGDQDGLLYLVMELMTDGSLRTLLYRRTQGQSWSLSLGLDLVRQAAEGLAAAHEKKVVHRDIKPDNLMLNRQSGPGQVGEQYVLKISDFGLARLAAGSGLTATGTTMGTLTYMSPEQCLGVELDGRSDLYSLGIVLYEISVGSPPFQIDNLEDAYNKHVNTPPPLPRQLRPDLPPSIEEIILRCLAKKPDERYATGTELAQALQRAMGDRGLTTIAPLRLPPMPSALMKSTAFQASGAGGMPPPVVSTLLQPAKVPRVRVLDQSGKTLRVEEVTSAGLTIGRHPRNDIVLDAQGVSRQHLRIQGDGRQVTVTDLGSSNGTWLGEQRLSPQVSQPWAEGKAVRIGPYWLRLEAPNAEAMASMASMPGTVSHTQLRGAPPQRYQYTASMAGSGRIGMRMEPEALTITPGQPATTQVTLINQGSIVDWFTVTVEGVAPEWVQGTAQTVQLNPGMEQAVTLNMNVARTAYNRAGDYPVTIRARSREKPDESGTAQARWTVLPFQEDELMIEPRRASGQGKAAYTITMRNSGNIPAHHVLSGDDDEQKLAYGFGFNPVALEPGNETKIPLTVSTRRHWLGREQRQPFQIYARRAESSSPKTAPAEFVNKALIPGWVLPVVGAVLAASIALGAFLGPLHGSRGSSPTPPPTQATKTVPTQATKTVPTQVVKTGSSPTATPTPTPTPTPTATPTPTPTPTPTATTSQTHTLKWSSWGEVPGGGTTDVPLSAAQYAGKLYLFAKGIDQKAYVNISDGTNWSGWSSIPDITTDAALSATQFGDKLYLFAKGTDQQVNVNIFDGTNWGAWSPIPGITTDAALSATQFGNKLYLFAKKIDDRQANVSIFDGTNWGAWSPIPGITTDAALSATQYAGKLYLFAKGSSAQEYVNIFDSTSWGGWNEVPGSGTTDAALSATQYSGKLYLFAKGNNEQKEYFNIFDGTNWGGWNEVPGGGTTDAALSATQFGNKLYLFAKGNNEQKEYFNVATF